MQQGQQNQNGQRIENATWGGLVPGDDVRGADGHTWHVDAVARSADKDGNPAITLSRPGHGAVTQIVPRHGAVKVMRSAEMSAAGTLANVGLLKSNMKNDDLSAGEQHVIELPAAVMDCEQADQLIREIPGLRDGQLEFTAVTMEASHDSGSTFVPLEEMKVTPEVPIGKCERCKSLVGLNHLLYSLRQILDQVEVELRIIAERQHDDH